MRALTGEDLAETENQPRPLCVVALPTSPDMKEDSVEDPKSAETEPSAYRRQCSAHHNWAGSVRPLRKTTSTHRDFEAMASSFVVVLGFCSSISPSLWFRCAPVQSQYCRCCRH
ncbi:hypothetical protein MRX96_015023 [Rhipicephalus microplus]